MSSSEPEVIDRFAFIDILAGNIPPSQLAILRNSPFLNDDPPPSPTTPTSSDDHRPSPMTPPADDPILICSLPQTQTQTEPEPEPEPEPETRPASVATTEKSPAVEGDKGKRPAKDSNQPLPKKSAGSRRRSRGVVLVSYSDSDDGEIEHQAAAPPARMLPATLRAPKKEDKARDPSGKSGSGGENPTPALKTPIKKEKERDPSEKTGPESEKAGSTNPSSSSAPSNENTPPPPTNLLDAIRLLFPPVDPKLGEMDILDICAMKGIHFENPRWHRPGGYGRKPKDPK